MNHSIRTGLSFGLTSGIITTLGLIIGLAESTNSKLVVIGGILTIAIADSFSDALGIHISEESENKHSESQIWQSTIATFASKFVFALSFAVPVILLDLRSAMAASVGWAVFLIGSFSYYLAKREKTNPWSVIRQHLIITAIVVVSTYYAGQIIATSLGGV